MGTGCSYSTRSSQNTNRNDINSTSRSNDSKIDNGNIIRIN